MKRIIVTMMACVLLFSQTAAGGVTWRPSGGGYFLRVVDGRHDGWWYANLGGQYVKHSRLCNADCHPADFRSLFALSSSGYPGAYASPYGLPHAQSGNSVYSYNSVVGPLSLDVDQRAQQLIRIAEQLGQGSKEVSAYTVEVLREGVRAQKELQAQQARINGMSKLLDGLKALAAQAQGPVAPTSDPTVTPGATTASPVQAIVTAKCVRCHQPGGQYPTLDLRDLSKLDDKWEPKILDRITTVDRAKRMPRGGTLTAAEISTLFKASSLCGPDK